MLMRNPIPTVYVENSWTNFKRTKNVSYPSNNLTVDFLRLTDSFEIKRNGIFFNASIEDVIDLQDQLNSEITSAGIPVLQTQPVSPANDDIWILQASLQAGSAMGMMGMTYAATTPLDSFKLQLKTSYGIKEINFI